MKKEMFMWRSVLFSVLRSFFRVSFTSSEGDNGAVITMTVASRAADDRVFKSKEPSATRIWVKEEDKATWGNINLNSIIGFSYQEGYEYILKVKKTRILPEYSTAEELSVVYFLEKVISKSRKESVWTSEKVSYPCSVLP